MAGIDHEDLDIGEFKEPSLSTDNRKARIMSIAFVACAVGLSVWSLVEIVLILVILSLKYSAVLLFMAIGALVISVGGLMGHFAYSPLIVAMVSAISSLFPDKS